MTGENKRALRSYLSMDEDLLLETLGDLLLGEGPGFGGPADRDARGRFAQAWLERKAAEFYEAVCGDVRSKLERDKTLDMAEDAAVIADALAAALGHPMATVVAVILLRRGLDKVCDESSN
jgi:hypothetical protein